MSALCILLLLTFAGIRLLVLSLEYTKSSVFNFSILTQPKGVNISALAIGIFYSIVSFRTNQKIRAAPRLCRPFLFRNSPPQKNKNEERQGERAGRAVLRAWRASHAIGAHFLGQSHHAPGAREIKGSAGSKSELFVTMTT